MTTPRHPTTAALEAARVAEAGAQAELEREFQRIEKTKAELQALEEQVRLADPDGRDFAKIVQARDLARARLSALTERIPNAEASARSAGEALAAADREAALVELEALQAERSEKSTALATLAGAFLDQFAAELQAFQATRKGDAIDELRRRACTSTPATDADGWGSLVDALRAVEERRAWEERTRDYHESGQAERDDAARRARNEREAQEREVERVAQEKFGGDLGKAESFLFGAERGVFAEFPSGRSLRLPRAIDVLDAAAKAEAAGHCTTEA
jgi:hypothetical protein